MISMFELYRGVGGLGLSVLGTMVSGSCNEVMLWDVG